MIHNELFSGFLNEYMKIRIHTKTVKGDFWDICEQIFFTTQRPRRTTLSFCHLQICTTSATGIGAFWDVCERICLEAQICTTSATGKGAFYDVCEQICLEAQV